MGMNYYVIFDECEHCNRQSRIHLGKQSCGWSFTFAYNGGQFYKNVVELKRWLKGKRIMDEEMRDIPFKDFWEEVRENQKHLAFSREKDAEYNVHFMIGEYRFLDCEFS